MHEPYMCEDLQMFHTHATVYVHTCTFTCTQANTKAASRTRTQNVMRNKHIAPQNSNVCVRLIPISDHTSLNSRNTSTYKNDCVIEHEQAIQCVVLGC